ncbi:MAG: AMP-dependent synthetase [Actinobacteria bacterium]|nr:MAG: AMP-dependent synthetase [Actinomycetota bacterium]
MGKRTESYWPADTSVALQNRTVGDLLREAATDSPNAVGLVAGIPGVDRRWTFAEMLADAERVALALLARFSPGDRVAVWAPNLPEWVLLEFGAALAGVVLVTVNPAYQRHELAYVLGQSGATGIVLVNEWRGNPMRTLLDAVRGDLPELREVVRFEEWDEFLDSGVPAALPAVSPDDPAQIQYTSGTTGFPKGAFLRHGSLTDNAALFAEEVELVAGDVYVDPMPLFHTAGCVLGVLGSLHARAAHVPVVAFDPAFVLELIERERGTALLGVPTMQIALLEHPDRAKRDLSSLRSSVSGGSLVPAELVRRIEETFGARFCIVYGTTECSPLVTMTRFADTPEDKAETIGRPLSQTEVKIVDPVTGDIVAPGVVGELCARGYMVMHGYYENPAATADAIDSDGWYHTGDLASMDERGYCSIEGRLKDMIIRGGENIYPREIEAVLFEHPGVADVAVVGIPDDKWGEQVAAFVRPAGDDAPTTADLSAHVRARLAGYKAPRTWIFVDAFPLTGSGKVKKFELREQYLKGELTPSE